MKNLVKIFLAVTICAAALLSSCIKEESYSVYELMLDATITRSSTSSEQGDQIEDVMIWVFDKNNNYNKVGWVTYTAPANTYKDITIHVPVKVCGANGATYRLVAVVNKDKFKNTITFNEDTTYAQLTSASFDNSELIAQSLNEATNPGNPAVMPISHWCDVDVTEADAGKHKSVKMTVFRGVAKTHFYLAKKAAFELQVTTLELHNGYLPTGGMVLSNVAAATLSQQNAAPSWFAANSKIPANAAAASYSLVTSTSPVQVGTIASDKVVDSDKTLSNYTLVGSKLIYETNKVATTETNYSAVTSTDGYYYMVGYKVGGDDTEYFNYVALPAVARNHDYVVKATVDAGGEMTLTIIVNEWLLDVQEYNYQDIATITNDGHIKWSNLPTVSGYNAIDADTGQVKSGVINLTANEGASGKFTFTLATPLAGNWIAELRTVKGTAGAIVFADGSTVMTGLIDNQPNELTIKNLAYNSAGAGGVQNEVELHIYATAYWGDVLRSYRVEGIVGNDVTFQDYKIIQPTGM